MRLSKLKSSVSVSLNKYNYEIENWLIENVGGYLEDWEHLMVGKYPNYTSAYWFKNSEDATLFRLRFSL